MTMRTTTRARTKVMAVAAVLLATTAGCGDLRQGGDAEAAADTAGTPGPDLPVAVGLDLYVGGEQVPGRWYTAAGRGTHWVALRDDGTWWWGYDAEPQRIDGEID